MSGATNRALIKAILESVPSIGLVHDYGRTAPTLEDYLALFKTTISGTNVIRAWMITGGSIVESQGLAYVANEDVVPVDGSEPGRMPKLRTREYVVYGFLSRDDATATEKTAEALMDTACDAFDRNHDLHDGDDYTGVTNSATATLDLWKFGSVVCHRITIKVRTTELEI
jgi:hypothetical protein